MLIAVSEFCRRVRTELPAFVEELQEHTGRKGSDEKAAWSSSLPVFARSLESPMLSALHLHLGRNGRMEVEYRLPSSGAWCDAVLLGRGRQGPGALIVEFKHWIAEGDSPGPTETLVQHAGRLSSHPSDQVGGYVDYCRRFHSAFKCRQSFVDGCVLFTRTNSLSPYLSAPHDRLVQRFPIFGVGHDDLIRRLPEWIGERLTEPDEDFARRFSDGVYQQDRSFVLHVSKLMQDPTSSPFVLLDEQRRAFDLIMLEAEKTMSRTKEDERIVFIVEGPPGSGKSVLGAQLWARLADHPQIQGNVVMCTTSGCQRANWENLFKQVSRSSAGSGLVIPANSFNPGLTPAWVKQEREAGRPTEVRSWAANLEAYRRSGRPWRSPDLQHAATVVDEAHALIDPTASNAEGVAPSGWSMHAGPQAWHIIRASRLTIFLLDSEQSYRDNETTTPNTLQRLALAFPGTRVVRVSLAGAQFRCGGSKEYVQWVEGLLAGSSARELSHDWRRSPAKVHGSFEFDVAESPLALERALRDRHEAGASVRLVASYSRPWVTKDLPDPHDLPDQRKDFVLSGSDANGDWAWAKIWNYAPDQDYTMFVQGRPGCPIAADPLCEVGCPYVVRGFDFDFVGLLWMPDLLWRKDRWIVDIHQIHETAWKKTLANAKKKGTGSQTDAALLRLVIRGYRILLTRAIKGTFVWCQDAETRQHLQACLLGEVNP